MMKLYRLVDADHDPITAGKKLARTSDHSNQKFGPGMYFATSRDSALEFAATRNHRYTHLLECEVQGVKEADLADLAADPAVVARWNKQRHPQTQMYERYCQEKALKGLMWQSASGWVEVVIHAPYIDDNVLIVSVEQLDQQVDGKDGKQAPSPRAKPARPVSRR
jgi:hypothetical protein